MFSKSTGTGSSTAIISEGPAYKKMIRGLLLRFFKIFETHMRPRRSSKLYISNSLKWCRLTASQRFPMFSVSSRQFQKSQTHVRRPYRGHILTLQRTMYYLNWLKSELKCKTYIQSVMKKKWWDLFRGRAERMDAWSRDFTNTHTHTHKYGVHGRTQEGTSEQLYWRRRCR